MESQIMEWSQGMGKRLKEYFRSCGKSRVLLFCLASFLMMVLSLFCCLYEAVSLWKAEKVMRDMAPVAAAHAKWEKEKEWEKALAEDLNVWEKGSGHWQKRLIYLSEAAGTNVVLSSLEGPNGEIRIQGTAMTDEEARAFADLLGAAWGGQVRMEKLRREENSPLLSFSMVFREKGEPQDGGNPSEDKEEPL